MTGLRPSESERPLMDLQSPDAYGRSFASVYDNWYAEVTDAEQTAAFVAHHHQGGPVLELGVGTGRLAQPLARRGLTVVGLDGSPSMLDQGMSGSARWIPVRASFGDLPLRDASVGSVLLAFNTVFNLTDAQRQQRLFHDVARILAPGGSFIVEALDVTELLDGPRRSIGHRPGSVEPLVVTATQFKRSTQQVTGHHLEIDDAGIRVRPWMLRWSTPAQLDAMADHAGLALTQRYSDWHGGRFGATSTAHVSRYQHG